MSEYTEALLAVTALKHGAQIGTKDTEDHMLILKDRDLVMDYLAKQNKQNTTLTERVGKLTEALDGVLPYLKKSDDIEVVTLAYQTPANKLRTDALCMELRDKAIDEARQTLADNKEK